MPIVQIELLEGRTTEQKRKLVSKVTDAIVDSVDCSKENVTIVLREMPTNHLAKAGILDCDK